MPTSSGDIDLSVVIRAILDAKGFEEVQGRLKELAGAAGRAKPPLTETGEAAGKMGKEFGGSRGAVADLTRVLLQNIGVTGPAGEAAKAAGTAMSFAAGRASLLAVGATGVVAAVAVLLPMLVSWIQKTRETKDEHQALTDSLSGLLGQLEQYIDGSSRASAELIALRDLLRDEALRAQAKEIEDLTKKQAENRKTIEDLNRAEKERFAIIDYGSEIVKEQLGLTEEEREKRRQLTEEIDKQQVRINALLTAHADGVTVGQQVVAGLKREREARDENAAAIDRSFELMQLSIEGQNAETEAADALADRRAKLAEDQDRDAERDIAREGIKQDKKAKDDRKRDTENTLLIIRNRKLQEEADERLAAARRALQLETINAYAQAASAFAGLFGKSKAINIAAALVATYAGAAESLSEKGVPFYLRLANAIATIAYGLQQVATIRKTEVGFDNPFADLVAEQLGEKSAIDFVRNFGVGFRGGMEGAGGAVYNYSTTNIHRGPTIGNFNASGYYGVNKTVFMKRFKRDLIVADRLENRTRI